MIPFRILLLMLSVLGASWLQAPRAMAQDDPADAPVARAACREGRGDADRCASYSYYLNNGIGVARNDAEAVRYGDLACEGGSMIGCLNAGVALRFAIGGPMDEPRTVRFFERGCTGGLNGVSAGACLQLGISHQNGLGTPVNGSKALTAYQRACERDRGEACRWAGQLMSYGNLVPRNDEAAVMTFRAGCRLKNAASCAMLGYHAKWGRGMPVDWEWAVRGYLIGCAAQVSLTCSYIEEVRAGDPTSPAHLQLVAQEAAARAFPDNLPVEQRFILARAAFDAGDTAMATAGFQTLAEEGMAEAQFNLGRVYYEGEGVPVDRPRAIRYYQQAANRSHPYAMYLLGQLNWHGIDMAWNPEWGVAMMRGAEEAGLAEAGPIWRQWQAERNAYFDSRDAANRQMAIDNERSQSAADAANMARIWGLYSSSQNQQGNGQVCGTIYRNNQANHECMARETFDNYYNPNR